LTVQQFDSDKLYILLYMPLVYRAVEMYHFINQTSNLLNNQKIICYLLVSF